MIHNEFQNHANIFHQMTSWTIILQITTLHHITKYGIPSYWTILHSIILQCIAVYSFPTSHQPPFITLTLARPRSAVVCLFSKFPSGLLRFIDVRKILYIHPAVFHTYIHTAVFYINIHPAVFHTYILQSFLQTYS